MTPWIARTRAVAARCWWLACGISLVCPTQAADSAPAGQALSTNSVRGFSDAAPAPVRRLGDGVYEVGLVTLDQAAGTVSFPGAVNLRAGVVEYALVTRSGKIHESVFVTAASPMDVHVALLLLGVRPASTNAFPEDLSLPPPGEPVQVEVSWTRRGRTVKRRLEECVAAVATRRPLARGPWVYNGSLTEDGRFLAQLTGSIVALQIDPAALINNPRPGRDDDTFHQSNRKLLPPEGTPVRITIRRATRN